MQFELWRGFNRLIIVLTIVWALFCAIVVPVVFIHRITVKLEAEHIEANTDCTHDYSLTGDELKRCYEMSDATWKEIEKPFSLKNFWLFDVQTWQRLVPMIFLPPLMIYVLATLVRWIWRGFKPKSGERA